MNQPRSHYEIDWDHEFNRHKPAIPLPPCEVCGGDSAGRCSGCHVYVCDDCVDWHLEEHHGLRNE